MMSAERRTINKLLALRVTNQANRTATGVRAHTCRWRIGTPALHLSTESRREDLNLQQPHTGVDEQFLIRYGAPPHQVPPLKPDVPESDDGFDELWGLK